MKRISILLIVFAALFVACSKPTLEEKGLARIKPAVEQLSGNHDRVSILNQKTVFASDSICVIQFDLELTNENGEPISEKMEYFIQRDKDHNQQFTDSIYECIYSLNDHKSIIQMGRDFVESVEDPEIRQNEYLSNPNSWVYSYGILQRILCGRSLVEP